MNRFTASTAALACTLALVGAACSSSTTATNDASTATTAVVSETAVATFPGAAWETADPASVGMDPAAIAEVADYLKSKNSYCMAVVKDGKLIGEEYWQDTTAETDHEIFSASKSVTSTLVGIAQDEGYLSIDDKASQYLTEWQGTPSEDVTIRDLVSNDSGRYWDFNTDYMEMAARAPDKTAFAIGLDQQFAPGDHWEYNNSAIQTLEAVLERATRQDMGDYAAAKLFDPIGMTSEYKRDPSGNPLAFMGVQASCQDLARFGWLIYNEGNWDGTEVVSADWTTEATAPSQPLNAAYGFLWWLNNEGTVLLPTLPPMEGPIWKNVPTTAYAALGLGNQIVVVLPEQGIVIVREGPAGGDTAGQGNIVDEAGKLLMAGLQPTK